MFNLKYFLINCGLAAGTIVSFLILAELFTRLVWNVGYQHTYDWRDRKAGYSQEKGSNTYRIVILGDSFAYGQGVRVEETFGKRIENYLNKNSVGGTIKKYEVINISWPGVNTAQEFYIFRDKGLLYNPDMLIVAYLPNDAGSFTSELVDPEYPLYIRRPPNRQNQPYALPLPAWLDKWLTINSDFYIFFVQRYNSILYRLNLRKTQETTDRLLSQYDETSNDWKTNKNYLERLYQLCEERNVVPLLVILPFMHNLEAYKYESIYKKVSHVSSLLGYQVLDLLPFFKGKKSKDYIVSRIDTHPNADAHEIMAKAIQRFVMETIINESR